jgi:GDP-L-fucose synthase
MEKEARIYVAGAADFIGQAIVRELERQGYCHLVGRAEEEPDLTERDQVEAFFARMAPEYVFMAAGKILGIGGNQRYPAELMLNNLLVECHVIDSAYRHGVKKLLYLGSGCSYPKLCPQPMGVESLMTGLLEPTSEFYATAKIAGIKLCEAYRRQYGVHFVSAIPANPFGLGDDFDPEDAHVIGALIRRMHEAKANAAPYVEIWGSGTPRREFIFVDDLANACVFVMRYYNDPQPINLGSGAAMSIAELATLIQAVVGYEGALRFDTSKPDGMPLKVFDSSRLASMGWQAQTSFRTALTVTYQWFLKTIASSEALSD